MLVIQFVLYIFGFNQGTLGIGEKIRNELIIMINNVKQAAVIVFADIQQIGAKKRRGLLSE